MMSPLYKYGLFGDEVSLIVAFVIGIGFGFFLERAGFGNARLLAAQFYFRDLRVLKVMFTAIVTAMTGLFLLSAAGVVDLSLVYTTPTFLAPQILGGLLLGVGFIIGGYCPGTSCVSAATGRIDGMVYLAGMVGGLVGFAELYPAIEGFAKSTGMGRLTLPEITHIPYGVLVLAVVLMAFGAFAAAEWAEARFGNKKAGPGSLLEPTRRITPVRRFALLMIGLGVVAAWVGSPSSGAFARVDTKSLALGSATQADQVSAGLLADWLVEQRNDFLVVDLREGDAFSNYHIPGSINVPVVALNQDFAPKTETLVLCGADELQTAQAWLLLRARGYKSVKMMTGGLDAWKQDVLFPNAPAETATPEAKLAFAAVAARAKHFGGSARGATETKELSIPELPKVEAPASNGTVQPVAKKRRKEGC